MRVAKGINKDKDAIASTRTCLDGSDNAFTNVVWNCGTKARNAGPPLIRTRPNVCKIATFTFDGFRSPTIRNNGPVIFTINGPAKYFAEV